MLNNILKVYSILTSGKGSFPRWRQIWLSGSYNSYISITIQSRKVEFSDFGLNKAMKSLNYQRLIIIDKSKMAASKMF